MGVLPLCAMDCREQPTQGLSQGGWGRLDPWAAGAGESVSAPFPVLEGTRPPGLEHPPQVQAKLSVSTWAHPASASCDLGASGLGVLPVVLGGTALPAGRC